MMNTMKQSQWEMGHKVVNLHPPVDDFPPQPYSRSVGVLGLA